MPENKDKDATKMDTEMQLKFKEMQDQLVAFKDALDKQTDTITKQADLIATQTKTVETLEAAKTSSVAEIAKLTEENTKARQREAQAEAARLSGEALHFVEARSNKDNMKLMPSQREYARRLYAMLGDDVELITATEVADLKLFNEKAGEKAKALTPRECLKRLIDTWPGAEALGKEMALHTEPKEETFEDALNALMFSEKMDPANHEDRQKAVRLLIAKNPSLMPAYGNSRLN